MTNQESRIQDRFHALQDEWQEWLDGAHDNQMLKELNDHLHFQMFVLRKLAVLQEMVADVCEHPDGTRTERIFPK